MWLNMRHTITTVDDGKYRIDWWCKACGEHLGKRYLITRGEITDTLLRDKTYIMLMESIKVADDENGVPYCLNCWNVQDFTHRWPKNLHAWKEDHARVSET